MRALFSNLILLLTLQLIYYWEGGAKAEQRTSCSAAASSRINNADKGGGEGEGGRKIVCHIGLWTTEYNHGSFNGDILDPFICTHYVLDYYGIDRNQNKWNVQPPLPDLQKEIVSKVLELKKINPNLRILIAIGGYTDNRDDTSKYFDLTSQETNTLRFVKATLTYLMENPLLDGIDFQWNYPGRHPDTNADAERELLGHFTGRMCSALRGKGYICMITLQRPTFGMEDERRTRDALATVIKEADLVTIWTADIPPEPTTFVEIYHTDLLYKPPMGSPFYEEVANNTVEAMIELITNQVLDKDDVLSRKKLLLTIPMQANSFSLKKYSANWTQSWPTIIGDPSTVPKPPEFGEKTNSGYETGLEQYPYFKVCRQARLVLNNERDKLFLYSQYMHEGVESAPFAYNKGHLIPTNTPESVRDKVNFGRKMKLGGVSVFQITADDVKGWCFNQTFPLLNAIFDQMHA